MPFNNGGFVRTSEYRSPSPSPQVPLPSSPSPSPVVVVVTEGPKASPSPSVYPFVEEEVSPSLTSDISPTSRQVENIEVIRVGPKGRLLKKRRRKSRTQQVNTGRQPIVSESRPTTYHPPTVVSQDAEEEVIPTQRVSSRFRYSTTTTTPSPQTVASSADQNQLIASRLKSLERQIRFKNRSKSS